MNKSTGLSAELYQYLLSISLREPEILSEIRNFISKRSDAQKAVPPEQAQFLGFLIKMLNAKDILELGTYVGYSAIAMALNLPDGGKIITCDTDSDVLKIAEQFAEKANVKEKINFRLQTAESVLSECVSDQKLFDFIFIDADKSQQKKYYELALQLMNKNTIIAIDNVFWRGRVIDSEDQAGNTKAIRELNRYLHADQRIELSVLPMGDGLTLIQKR